MATYVISDIHGACDEFLRLLERIRLRQDGSDVLYLLGDYGDWGAKSMETILAVKAMDETCGFVHCLAGNHELMFLEAIEGGIVDDEANESAVNWLVNNRGLITWNAYMNMSADAREDLHGWLRSLPFSYDVRVNGRLYMLAHAYPYFYDMDYSEEEIPLRRRDAVWRRLLLHENPFSSYTGSKSYDGFICGHTIVDRYWQKSYLDQNPSVMDSVVNSMKSAVPGGHNRIFHGDKFIDIDCGAKCFAFSEDPDSGLLRSMKQALVEQAQLSAYCLDTGEEFYVGRPGTVAAGAVEGSVDVAPGLRTPERDPVRPPETVHRAVKAARRAAEPNFSPEIPRIPARREEPVEYPERRIPHLNIPKEKTYRRRSEGT